VGDFALAFCEANNTDRGYFVYVANRIDGNASLEFEGNATVNASEAWANMSSHAEGDRIRGWANRRGGQRLRRFIMVGSAVRALP
jgi:hypothetical protein